LAEDERGPDASAKQQRDLDEQVEDLTRRIADVVNSAGVERRQDLREYAIDLLKEETERSDALPTPSSSPAAPVREFNALSLAMLLVLVSVPLLFSIVFAYVGLAILVVAALMATWGVLAILLRRPRPR
jgi:Flp pilus assembly protein TadB